MSPLQFGGHIYENNEENNGNMGAEELFLDQEDQVPEDEIVLIYESFLSITSNKIYRKEKW